MENNAQIIDLTKRLPTKQEIDNASEAAQALAQTTQNGLNFIGKENEEISLSPSICKVLVDLLGHISRGNMVTIIPTGSHLTTQQAADILNVSRPYISNLLKKGEINYIPVGSHRRIPLEALLAYKEKRDNQRSQAIDLLINLGQECDKV